MMMMWWRHWSAPLHCRLSILVIALFKVMLRHNFGSIYDGVLPLQVPPHRRRVTRLTRQLLVAVFTFRDSPVTLLPKMFPHKAWHDLVSARDKVTNVESTATAARPWQATKVRWKFQLETWKHRRSRSYFWEGEVQLSLNARRLHCAACRLDSRLARACVDLH